MGEVLGFHVLKSLRRACDKDGSCFALCRLCPSRKPHPALTYLKLVSSPGILLNRPAHPIFMGGLKSYQRL